jgi:competence protein ComFC
MDLEINPIQIAGPWADGYTLDRQTIKSVPTGYDAWGHMQFDTTRTPLGELVYQLKNKSDKDAIDPIAEVAETYVRGWRISFELIVPAPPSSARALQPVVAVARRLAERLGKSCCENCIEKVKPTSQMKNQETWDDRKKALAGAFVAYPERIKQREILLLDDLFESGSTLREAAQALIDQGKAGAVYALALTRTKVWSK